jgi:protein-L-isoaspartate(D-aspartate) O-methyltransferase
MPYEPTDYEAARRAMVQAQLAGRGIRDERVLDAMARVPRELFVPEGRRDRAYRDGALSIGCEQTISQPYMVALMTAGLHLTGRERVLEVGTGSGYQTAVLAELAAHVYTIERVSDLAGKARVLVADGLGYANVSFLVGDGTVGWPEEAPFDRILVTAGAPHRPTALLTQLAPGGEAVVPVGGEHWQTLTHYRWSAEGKIEELGVCDCIFVKLIGEDGW